MTSTEQWMEDTVKGGWEYQGTMEDYKNKLKWLSEEEIYNEERMCLLDPEAWQAVGKTRVWSEPEMMKTTYENQRIEVSATGYFAQMLLFTALIAD